MTSNTLPAPASPTPQPPPPIPVPARTPRTHLNGTVIALLKTLPRDKKTALNKEKEARNLDRHMRRLLHASDPSAYPADGSDNESLITVSDDEEPLDPTDFFAKFPGGAAELLASIFSKRDRDADPEVDTSAELIEKRRRRDTSKEIKIVPGLPNTLGFHHYHFELSAYDVYMPLSLFSNSSLRAINRDSNSLALKKINPVDTRMKPPHVLDTDAFERKYGKEEDLLHHVWNEAARNYVRFAGETGLDGEKGDWFKRWDEHFGFFEKREDASENFEAIRELDIRMRKDYVARPFAYDAEWYEREYEKAKTEYRLKKMEKGSAWRNPFSSLGKSSDPKTSFSKATGRAMSSSPFRKGSGGDPATAVCLICARRGHMFSACSNSTFEDGKATFACHRDGGIQSVKGSHTFCRNWNIRGDGEKPCSHGDDHIHWCTFCGDKQHNAFSWSCRKAPAKVV